MPLLLSFLMLVQVATMPPSPVDPQVASCETPSADDPRPYNLCVAETRFEQADLELNRQWAATLAHVKAKRGAEGARRLHDKQRKWISDRDRECEALAAASPVTQAGRNEMSCMDILTVKRTAKLKAIAEAK